MLESHCPPDCASVWIARAAECGSTAHGMVQWAWAWAVARVGGYDQVALGVVRSAHWAVPQGKSAAGYLMTTVPIPARMEKDLTLGAALRFYREAVLAARDFTRADPREMAKGLGRPAGNLWDAVVMTENSSLEELVLPHLPNGFVSSIEIHERTGEPLTASAWLGHRSEIEIEALPERFSETRCETAGRDLVESHPTSRGHGLRHPVGKARSSIRRMPCSNRRPRNRRPGTRTRLRWDLAGVS